jgi:hypothetical protein
MLRCFSLFYCLLFIHFFADCETAANKKILITGVVKNGENGFFNSKLCIESLVKHFEDYRIIIYENNSTDKTKKLYSEWAKSNNKLIYISEDLTPEFLKNYTPLVGEYRCEFIARARNIVLKKALSNEFDDFDYILVPDLDFEVPWGINEILNIIENPKKEWDMVAANGSYDIFALRLPNSRLFPETIGYNPTIRINDEIGNYLAMHLKQGKWLKVESAFGGLAIYKRSSLKNCFYRSKCPLDYFEKITTFNPGDDPIFKKDPKKFLPLIIKNRMRFRQWEKSNFSDKAFPTNGYICEHVLLHFQMIRNGFDKLFIDPDLTMTTKEYKNYL